MFALCVIGGGSGSVARRSNPSRDTSSKHLHNQEAPEGSNASKRNIKTIATKIKEPVVSLEDMPLAEFQL